MFIPSSGLNIARLADDLVVLDLNQDAYFCLPGLGARLTQDESGLWFPDGDEIGSALEESGLFLKGRTGAAPPCAPPPARTSRQIAPATVASRSDLFRLVSVWARESRRIHGRPVQTLIRQSKRLARTSTDERAVLAAVHLFEKWSPWLPFQGLCLYRAYLLRAFLTAGGHGVLWIFGVRTWPFSAHCWLQLGDLLLDDDLDRVRFYTPILTVGP